MANKFAIKMYISYNLQKIKIANKHNYKKF